MFYLCHETCIKHYVKRSEATRISNPSVALIYHAVCIDLFTMTNAAGMCGSEERRLINIQSLLIMLMPPFRLL